MKEEKKEDKDKAKSAALKTCHLQGMILYLEI